VATALFRFGRSRSDLVPTHDDHGRILPRYAADRLLQRTREAGGAAEIEPLGRQCRCFTFRYGIENTLVPDLREGTAATFLACHVEWVCHDGRIV